MEVSSKDLSKARYKLSQSRKRAHRRKHGSHSSHGVHAEVKDSYNVNTASKRDLSEDEADASEQGADFGKLLQEASEYYGHAAHKKSAMLDALVAPQPALNAEINASQVRGSSGASVNMMHVAVRCDCAPQSHIRALWVTIHLSTTQQ